MLYTSIPYSPEKNLVKAYNHEMERLPNDNDFLAILDHDASFTTYDWYNQINGYIQKYPECGCFLATTNRVHPGNNKQKAKLHPIHDNFKEHWVNGSTIWNNYKYQIIDFSEPKPCHFSGFLMVLKKSLWKKIGGFKPWNKNSNILGIDSRLHQTLFEHKEKVYVMKGVYIYHVYRFGNLTNKKHLQ